MKIYLEDDAYEYLDSSNYPVFQLFIEGADLEHEADRVRKAKGYPPLFDWSDKRIQQNAWYDFKVQFNAETEKVIKLWAEINGDIDEDECPDWNEYTYLEFDSSDLISQIKKQLKENYGIELKDLKTEEVVK